MHHVTDGSLHEEIVTTQSLSSPLLLTVEIIENKPRTTTHHLTTPTSQFFKLHNGGQINSPRTTPLPRIILIIRSNRPKTSGNRGERGRIIPSTLPLHIKLQVRTTRNPPITTNQPHDSTTKPLTAFSSTQQAPPRHKKKKPVLSGDDQSQVSVNVPSGHMLINLREGSKEVWIRGVKFGLRHPDRMPAASEVPHELQPKPTKTVEIEEFNRAVATLKQVDSKIPNEIAKKAINLLFSTNLLPGFDLEKPFIIELPSTNMLALIIPLPETSHFQMPPPFKTIKITPVRFSMAPPLKHRKPSCWKERSDRPTGPSTRTTADVICPPLELFTLAERSPKAIPFLNGRPKNSWILSKRKGKDNKT